jgi:polynucleotide 5'-hydroxyl-kinase GRC3/NOL9
LAARRARQQQAQSAQTPKDVPQIVPEAEPPSKKPRPSLEGPESAETNGDRRDARNRAAKKHDEPLSAEITPKRPVRATRSQKSETEPELDVTLERPQNEESEKDQPENAQEMDEDDVASVVGDPDGYESPAETPAELQNFPLSKARLNKSNIVYSDENTLCIRIKERTVWIVIPGYTA